MNDEQYLQHARALFTRFAEDMLTRTRDLAEDDSLRELAQGFGAVARGELQHLVEVAVVERPVPTDRGLLSLGRNI